MARTLPRMLVALWSFAALAAAAPAAHRILPGQKAFGTISAADQEDEVVFHGDAGAKVTFTVKQRKGGTLLPVFTKVVDPSMADVLGTTVLAKTNNFDLNVELRQDGGATVVPPPATPPPAPATK